MSGGALNRPPRLSILDSWPLHFGPVDAMEAAQGWGEIWVDEGGNFPNDDLGLLTTGWNVPWDPLL